MAAQWGGGGSTRTVSLVAQAILQAHVLCRINIFLFLLPSVHFCAPLSGEWTAFKLERKPAAYMSLRLGEVHQSTVLEE